MSSPRASSSNCRSLAAAPASKRSTSRCSRSVPSRDIEAPRQGGDMKIDGIHYRTIWVADDGWSVEIIDQTRLPHEFTIIRLQTADDAARAIKDMAVRGAPLIGATAAYGLCLALREDQSDKALARAYDMLAATRPTAVNLKWSLDAMRRAVE